MKKIGVTKLIILEYCSKPRRWSEIVTKTERSEPSILVHVKELKQLGLLDKKNGFWFSSFDNKEAIKIAKQIHRLENKLENLLTVEGKESEV